MIPKRLVLPPKDCFGTALNTPHFHAMNYIYSSAEAAGVQVESQNLDLISDSCFPILVDDIVSAIEMSDYCVPPSCVWSDKYKFVFMYHYLSVFDPYKKIGSIPQTSFVDWNQYQQISQIDFNPIGKVRFCQEVGSEECPHIRRRKVLKMLQEIDYDGDKSESPEYFWNKSMNCLASIHIPGSHEHSMDRGQIQLFGLGVCTISPDIWSSCGSARPEPGIHYVCIRDDYSDLIDKISWCESHREECKVIGDRAKMFFADHCLPGQIWNYIGSKVIE